MCSYILDLLNIPNKIFQIFCKYIQILTVPSIDIPAYTDQVSIYTMTFRLYYFFTFFFGLYIYTYHRYYLTKNTMMYNQSINVFLSLLFLTSSILFSINFINISFLNTSRKYAHIFDVP